jgi:putative sterol carrier protein
MPSEIARIFEKLPSLYRKGSVRTERTFYFSLDDEKWTVSFSGDTCAVKPEKSQDADCFFKASKEMFLDVWNGRHKPSITDFVSGAIKSNNPMMLKDFVAAFQKKP